MIPSVNDLCALLARALVVAPFFAPAAASAAEPVVVPLAFHVVELNGHPVVEPQFLSERVARANQIFAPYGLAFAIASTRSLDAAHAALETRADRDALGAQVARGAIDCFVVRSLQDVDEPARVRRGVHWHSHTYTGAHFVILSSIAGPDVLAHELGHFFGNPEHSHTRGNLMSYERGDGQPFLEPAQVSRLTRALRTYLRRGELRALGAVAAPTRAQPANASATDR
jgi:hypothetical protein